MSSSGIGSGCAGIAGRWPDCATCVWSSAPRCLVSWSAGWSGRPALTGNRGRAARTWWALGDDDERAAAALSAVWERIQRYPIERRPGRVAANILMDAASDLRRAVRGAELVQASAAVEREPSDLQDPRDAATELAEVLVDAIEAGVIDRSDAALIAATRIAGTPLREIAQERAMPLRTAQWRRQRAEAALVTSSMAVA